MTTARTFTPFVLSTLLAFALGGGIFTAGPLTVEHCAITHNTASFGGVSIFVSKGRR